MKRIILASSNAGKIAELQALLDPIVCISQDTLGIESVEETGLSFVENALLKARNASKPGLGPALADDSGLVVPSLRGEPGIYSARYAGLGAKDADNNALLLSKLKDSFDEPVAAYFYCAIVVLQHAEDPTPLIATGLWQGQIAASPMGEAGFGYDPIFYLPEFGCTAAQLPKAIKNKISHRAQALSQLKELLRF